MSKAILVMDMPKSCAECRFSTIGCQDNDVCYLNNKEIYLDKKPDWCPLRDLPQKKEREIVQEDYNGGYSHGIVHGYNSCIDEILNA